jgi:hypothetical protein
MADSYAGKRTLRGYYLTALWLGETKKATGFVVNANSTGLVPDGANHHGVPDSVLSRLVFCYPISLAEAVRVLDHSVGCYDMDLRAQVVELAAELAKRKPSTSGV